MPNYNIQVVVDPSGAISGVNVVEANLDKVPKKAKAVEASIQRAFDFNTGPAVSATSAVDKALDGVKSSADAVGTAAQAGYSKAEAAALRAKGTIVNSNAQVRASQVSLGQQFNDFSTQVIAGGSVVTAFAQQSGQAALALQGMNGWLGTVGKFLAGPWGTVLIIATTVLAGFVQKQWEAASATEDALDKVRKDAEETEKTRQAKEIFANTLEGLTAAVRKNEEALKSLNDQTKTAAQRALESAHATRILLEQKRYDALVTIQQTEAQLELNKARAAAAGNDPRITGSLNAENDAAETRLAKLREQVSQANEDLQNTKRQIDEFTSRRAVELIDRTKTEEINDRYDKLIEQARRRSVAEGTVSTELAKQVRLLKEQRDAELKAEQDRKRESRSVTRDGVPRFRSQQQAIGIAGRELQGAGFRVSENPQFGGVTGGHKSSHVNAIDVNVGKGVVEANIPDLKKKFDDLALRYQARGYEVIWNGKFYAAGGNGPTKNASGHTDHIHVQAPKTIVGKPTQGSVESAAQRELSRIDQQADFVSSAIDQANQRGQSGVVNTAEAQIARIFNDYQRRFNEAMSDEDKGKVKGAINSAVARETANYFDQAYIKPLERLEELQGKTGITREVLNKQLEESARLGRELTPIESQQIENSIRTGSALQEQAEILERIRGPQEAYMSRIEQLSELLADGVINQTNFNSEVAKLGQSTIDLFKDMPGVDPVTGQSYADTAAREEENSRYAQEQDALLQHRERLLQMGVSYDALTEAARKRHVDKLNQIDQQRKIVAISAAQSTAESLLNIAENSVGQQSAVYKALFIASKAFAIADSVIKIQQGIANALSLPFPANLGAVASVAAAAASIVSSIQAVSLNLADGGFVSGPGTSRSDSIPANLSNGEFVVNAQATRNNRQLLEAINSGRRPVSASGDLRTTAPTSDGGVHISIGDINVTSNGGDGQQIGRDIKQTVLGIVREELGNQSRSGGSLTKTRSSVMSGG